MHVHSIRTELYSGIGKNCDLHCNGDNREGMVNRVGLVGVVWGHWEEGHLVMVVHTIQKVFQDQFLRIEGAKKQANKVTTQSMLKKISLPNGICQHKIVKHWKDENILWHQISCPYSKDLPMKQSVLFQQAIGMLFLWWKQKREN